MLYLEYLVQSVNVLSRLTIFRHTLRFHFKADLLTSPPAKSLRLLKIIQWMSKNTR